jgi:hypothetical protein
MLDPYRDWLGITEPRRPPTLYALLGLAPGAADAAAVEAAAARQLARVQAHIQGPHSKEAWRLIDEIKLAKATLLDPAKRAAYNAVFGMGPRPPAAPPKPPAPVRANSEWETAAAPPVEQESEFEVVSAEPPRPKAPPEAPESEFEVVAVKPPPKKAPPPPVNILDDDDDDRREVPSSDGLPTPPATLRPRRLTKRSGPNTGLIAGGVLGLALVAGLVVYLATRDKKSSDSPKEKSTDVADAGDGGTEHPAKKTAPVHPNGKEHEKEPKGKPAVEKEKKKTPPKNPPKNDPPPPPEVSDDFKGAKLFRGHDGAPKFLAVAPSGRQILSTADDLAVFAWTPDRDKPARRLTLKSPPAAGVAFLPGGKQMVAADGGFLFVLDLADNAVRKQITTPGGGFMALAAGADGKHVLTGSNDGQLRWWDVAADAPEKTLDAGGVLLCVAVSADGKAALAGDKEGNLSAWDLNAFKLVKKWKGHAGPVNSVAFAPDGKHAVSTADEKLHAAKVWDAATGALQTTLRGHTGEVTAAAYTTDGGLILTGSADQTVRAWDALTGDPLRFTHKAEAKVRSLALDPKDRFLVAGLGDGGVQVLPLPAVRPDSPPKGTQAQAPKTPLPPPSPALVEIERPRIREKYAADFERTAPDDVLALFDKLLTRARLAPELPERRYALFLEARDLAGKAGRMAEAFRAADERAKWFEADDLADKAAALKAAAAGTVDRGVVGAALGVVEEAERQARPDVVDELLRQAELFPQSPDTPQQNVRIEAAKKRWADAAAAREAGRQLAEALKKDSDGPAANAALGKHLCFRAGAWAEGLPRLARGDDAALKDLAAKDLAAPKEAKAQAALAKAWFDYAPKAAEAHRPGVLVRAKAWYEKAVAGDGLPPQEKLAAAQKISEIDKQMAAAGGGTFFRPGAPVTRRGFETMRSQAAFETQWSAANADGFTPEGVPLKADASLASRFRLLDGARVEFTFVPDGREVKVRLGGEEAAFKPAAGTKPVLLAVERRGKETRFALLTLAGRVEGEKVLPAKPEPAAMTFAAPGPAGQGPLRVTAATVNGSVVPAD